MSDHISLPGKQSKVTPRGQASPFVIVPIDQSCVPSFDGIRRDKSLPISVELTKKITEVAASLDATFVVVTCAAFFALLHRYSGLHHIVVGLSGSHQLWSHSAGADLQKVLGCFLNPLALSLQLSPSSSLRDLVANIKRAIVEKRLAKELYAGGSKKPELGHAVQHDDDVSVTFQCESSLTSPSSSQVVVDSANRPSQQGYPDFCVALVQRDGHWHAAIRYSLASYDEPANAGLLQHYLQLMEGCMNAPAQPIVSVTLSIPPERRQLLAEWNRTECDYPHDRCVHQLFEDQARLVPDRIAVLAGQKSITYGELDRQSEHLAEVLRGRGVGPDVLVGLCLERSLDLLIGILGILKAGGAYVPVDPTYPADRIAFVLVDSGVKVIVTQKSLLPFLGESGAERVLVDDLPTIDGARPVARAVLGSQHLAYVLYTSGSTGKPKGVQISHRAVVNFLHSMRRKPGLAQSDVLLAVTTLSFDIAGLELHLPLTTGATIVLAPWEVAADGHALLREIEHHRVTVLQATPATWRLILNAGWEGTPRLKALCGGEAMPAALAAEVLPRCAELWNMYGPTETTIWSTCCRITESNNITIGGPIDNTEVYILDAQLQPLPVGQAGELLIGGHGLARGYLNRPELTAERFITHPFKAGERLYRTGDLARYRGDGQIECLGRLDYQVKIRGFRIELGEIENQLTSHPGVKEAVVTAREDTPGEKRLVAYVVSRDGLPVVEDQLREYLRKKLPDHMMPAAFVSIAALPLTPNGKIDRKALPAPASGAVRTTLSECTPTEIRLAAIFEKILGRPIGSPHDSFFDLGGHSLLAANLMSAIEEQFDRRLPLAQLFEASSVAALGVILDRPASTEVRWDSLVPIQRNEGKPTLFLIHGAGGNVLLYRELAAALAPDISVFGFQSQGLDGHAAPLARVEDMAARYVSELRTFQPQGPYYIAGYCMGGSVAYEMARLLREQGQVVGLVALLDTYNFSLARQKNTFSVLRQKIGFHLENLADMKARNLAGYIGEKMRMAREAVAGKVSCRLASLKNKSNGLDQTSGALAFIQEINDQAAIDFMPRPLPGHLTVFRPRKQYDYMSDPKMGWAKLVSGHLDVVELSINPHAMLIDPYASLVAGELKKRLQQLEKTSG